MDLNHSLSPQNKSFAYRNANYNPITQKYRDQSEVIQFNIQQKSTIQDDYHRMRQTELQRIKAEKSLSPIKKYLRPYNIVNMQKVEGCQSEQLQKKTKNVLVPAVREFNIINNDKLDDFYFKNVRVLKQNKVFQKQFDESKLRPYNIINNQYRHDHETKYLQEFQNTQQMLIDKGKKMRDFDLISGTFYDGSKEKEFQQNLKVQQQNHGKDYDSKLPPSMVWRESVIVDPSKDLSEAQKKIDEKQRLKKKRFELRYKLEKEIKQKELENDNKKFQHLISKFDEKRMTEEYEKGFDIITLQNNSVYVDGLKQHIAKEPSKNNWEKIKYASDLHLRRPRRSTFNNTNLTMNAETQVTEQILNQTTEINDKVGSNQLSHPKSNGRLSSQKQNNQLKQINNSITKTLPDEESNSFYEEIEKKRFSINESDLRNRYHMPNIQRGTLPSLNAKNHQIPQKINQTQFNEIHVKPAERTVEISELKMNPTFVQPRRRIKTGAFFLK